MGLIPRACRIFPLKPAFEDIMARERESLREVRLHQTPLTRVGYFAKYDFNGEHQNGQF